MKQILLLTVFTILSSLVSGQKPENVYSITKAQKNYAYYSEQAGLWEKELKTTPKDASAWLNYYTAARMNNMFAKEGDSRYDMKVIAEDLKKSLPNTFEYYYVSYKQEHDREKGYPSLKKAYTVDPNRYETWEGFISKAELEGEPKAMKAYFEKWFQHEMYSPGITCWNYNALIGLEPNAIFLTFGDNDTYPLWLLQQFKEIRTDVQVLNTSLLVDPDYRKMMFEKSNIPAFEKKLEDMGNYKAFRNEIMEHVLKNTDRPAYVGISAPASFREKMEDQLFITGLTYKYCTHDFDHVAVIRNNFENLFLKDYLTSDLNYDFSQSVVDYMSQQYIPCLTVLYKHYLLSGEKSKADDLKDLLARIGERSNRQEEMKHFFAKFETK